MIRILKTDDRKTLKAAVGMMLGVSILLTACGEETNIVVPSSIGWDGTHENEFLSAIADGEFADAHNVGETQPDKLTIDDSQPDKLQTDEPQSKEADQESVTLQESEPIPETEPIPDPDIPEEIRITITAAGDVTMGNHMEQGYDATFRQTYDNAEDKSYFFENVADIFREDDLTIVNLEGVLTFSEEHEEGRTYNIKGDPEYAYLLSDASIEAVSMGNNHRLDYGEEGSRDTVAALEEAGVAWAYDSYTGIYESQGIKIGWVSINEASQGQYVENLLKKGIAKLKEEGAQLILACCHWGTEREYYPEDYQKELGRKCIDWGADLVIGHHPHVLQGIDQYQGKYIVYSLGNFCFGANRNPSDKDTMIFQQTFVFRQGDAQAQPGEARIIPCRVSSVTSRNDFKPTPLTGEEGQRVIDRVNKFSLEFGVAADEQGILTY